MQLSKFSNSRTNSRRRLHVLDTLDCQDVLGRQDETEGIALLGGQQGCAKGAAWDLIGAITGMQYVSENWDLDFLNTRFESFLDLVIFHVPVSQASV